MTMQLDVEKLLQADAEDLDRDFPRTELLERRILARVASTPREERRGLTMTQELALAGLLVATVALLVVEIGRLRAMTQPVEHKHNPPTVIPSPRTTLCAAPCQPLTVDPTKPVLLLSGLNGEIDGMTWDGRSSGKVLQTAEGGIVANPAGTLVVASSDPDSPPEILDRSGQIVSKLTGGPYAANGVGQLFYGLWADDRAHYCQVVPFFAPVGHGQTVHATLQVMAPGGVPRDVARVGQASSDLNNVRAAACSVLADRAVVVEVNPRDSSLINQYWVVQLSTGRVLWTDDVRAKHIVHVVASSNGLYVAELDSSGTTTIYGPGRSPVAHITGSVTGFSWDGSLAIVTTYSCPAPRLCGFTHVRVVRWRDGTILWLGPPDEAVDGSEAEPGGTSLAFETQDLSHPVVITAMVGNLPGFVYVVSSEGHVLARLNGGSLLSALRIN